MGAINYYLHQPSKFIDTQTYDINLLKCWIEPISVLSAYFSIYTEPAWCTLVQLAKEPPRQDLSELVDQFRDMSSVALGRTHLALHNIKILPAVVTRQCPYCVLEACQQAVKEEIEQMLCDS